jgi:hypothetical protein
MKARASFARGPLRTQPHIEAAISASQVSIRELSASGAELRAVLVTRLSSMGLAVPPFAHRVDAFAEAIAIPFAAPAS